MPRYVLLLGSNQDAEAALERACAIIERNYGILRIGAFLPSPDRDDADARPAYLNCALEIASPLAVADLKLALREIESTCGRIRPLPAPGVCAMDIDIALVFEHGAWRVNDAKAVAPDYAQAALSLWLASQHVHTHATHAGLI